MNVLRNTWKHCSLSFSTGWQRYRAYAVLHFVDFTQSKRLINTLCSLQPQRVLISWFFLPCTARNFL